MKKDQYFSFEVNMISDDNIISMLGDFDTLEPMGVYSILLAHLRTKDDYEASCKPSVLKEFGRQHKVTVDVLLRILHDYNLFVVDEERQTFRSPYIDRVMKRLEDRMKANANNGKKGGRPKKKTNTPETPASKGQKPNQNQEKRREEKRNIPTVEYNSSNISERETAADDDVTDGDVTLRPDTVPNEKVGEPATKPASTETGMKIRQEWEEGQRPLQPVRPWEELVDELSGSQMYMELAGQRSGLGELFVNSQALIIKYFKEHIKLYGKGSQLLFPDDVRCYFSNFISAGSITCKKLREHLLAQIQTFNNENKSRFETLIDGKRTYMGHLIPDNAPARPDANAVWNTVQNNWGY